MLLQARPIMRFKGHQNTAKRFIGCGFGPDESLAIGGSEVSSSSAVVVVVVVHLSTLILFRITGWLCVHVGSRNWKSAAKVG